MSDTRTTAVALLTTLAVTAGAVTAFLTGTDSPGVARTYLALFGALFAVRVGAQIGVIRFRPRWLPATGEWNLLPYRILLPIQLCLLVVIAAIVAGPVEPGPETGRALVVFALVYWATMGVRYAVRMTRRPDQRWFGGAIPILFHCVLAAFVFVLGASSS